MDAHRFFPTTEIPNTGAAASTAIAVTTPNRLVLTAMFLSAILQDQGPVMAQEGSPQFSGRWGDSPVTAEGTFCQGWCTQVGLDRLNALLDDPANDSRPFTQLADEARRYEFDQYIVPRLTPAARDLYPISRADDPGLLRCEPWGVARQFVAIHAVEISQFDDRLELQYAEWYARRTIHLGRSNPPADLPLSPLGYSLGHFEGRTLVVETTGISASTMLQTATEVVPHSNQLRLTERYTIGDERQLMVTATLDDAWAFTKPVEIKRTWEWAPQTQIVPGIECQIPTKVVKPERRQ